MAAVIDSHTACLFCNYIQAGDLDGVKQYLKDVHAAPAFCTCTENSSVYKLIKFYHHFLSASREDHVPKSDVWKSPSVFGSSERTNVLEIIANLLGAGVRINYRTGVETPLMAALSTHDEHLLGMMLDFGADVNMQDSSEDINALGLAILLDEVSLVEPLLKHGGQVNAPCCDSLVPIQLALNKKPAVSDMLIQYGADLHFFSTISPGSELLTIDCPLGIAIIRRNVHLAKLLLDHGEDVDKTYGDSLESPIHLAIKEDDEEMVKVLIRFGANISKHTKSRFTPLGLALTHARSQGDSIAKLLVRSGACPNNRSVMLSYGVFYTPLHIACFKGKFEFVKFLVEEAFIQSDTFLEETSSEILTSYSSCNNFRYHRKQRVQAEGNYNSMKSGRKVSKRSRSQRLKHLLNQRSGDGSTPLFMAALNGDLQIVEYLLRAGADPHFVSLSGNFFHAAVKSKCLDVIKKGFELGCDVNHSNSLGDTPLHLASRIDLPEICELLLTGGADLNARNRRDETPLMKSAIDGLQRITSILLEHGSATDGADDNNSSLLKFPFLYTDETIMKVHFLAGAHFSLFSLFSYVLSPNSQLSCWIRQHFDQRMSLQTLSCFSVRNQLIKVSNGRSILWRIEALPIPRRLKDLLLLKNRFEMIDL